MSIQAFKAYLEREFGIVFHNDELLLEALTQRNFLNEHPELTGRDYQRLEFLGDAIMQVAVADYLFHRYPEWDEGQLTEMRITMVQTKSFAHFAKRVHLDEAVRIGKGEEMSGARKRASLLEDIWEAFIGALYLDAGNQAVTAFLQATLFAAVDTDFFNQFIDFKSRLQEKLQTNGAVAIQYETLGECTLPSGIVGFRARVSVDGKPLAEGTGKAIKEAEKAAARVALQRL